MRRSLLLAALAVAAACVPAPPAAAAPRTVWLCRPGLERNRCTPGQATTRIAPGGRRLAVVQPRNARRPADCFYVYPTVSDQQRPEATLRIDPELRSIARYQAARFSRTCRVFAPVYRQITLSGLFSGGVTPAMRERAYADVLRAWRTYLRRYNHGRPFVLLGHSQGTFVLRRLAAEEIDRRPAVRRRLLSALLLGGNVTVARGRDAGGDFRHIRACRSRTQLSCVVAFSTYGARPPENSLFGRAAAPLEVLCTNPAALAGGAAALDSVIPSRPFAPATTIGAATRGVGFPQPRVPTPWIEARGAYRGRCVSRNGANVLRIAPVDGAPQLQPVPDATWGLHLVDANVALGDLVWLVGAQEVAYARRAARPPFTG